MARKSSGVQMDVGYRNGIIPRQSNMGRHMKGEKPFGIQPARPVEMFYGTSGMGTNDGGEVFNVRGDRHDGRGKSSTKGC